MSLGEYPAITLADARILKDEMRAKLAKGIHPVEDRQNNKAKALEEGKIHSTLLQPNLKKNV